MCTFEVCGTPLFFSKQSAAHLPGLTSIIVGGFAQAFLLISLVSLTTFATAQELAEDDGMRPYAKPLLLLNRRNILVVYFTFCVDCRRKRKSIYSVLQYQRPPTENAHLLNGLPKPRPIPDSTSLAESHRTYS